MRRLVAIAVASCFAPTAHGNPTGAQVVSGQATIVQQGKQLTITNTPGAVIHWQGFSIRADEATRFVQQSAASAVLNRVVGTDPSKILGTLSSNGRVFLINPNGILFGPDARVDVAGLVASSLDIANKDFAAGKLKFGETPGAKPIENQGSITTAGGGEVLLIAPDVKNSGVITSPKGEVILAAGRSVEIVDPKSPHMRVEITAPANEAVNLGSIVADGGRVSIYATAIRNSGRIQANTVERTKTGEIVLRAKKDVVLEKDSVITANGETAGKVVIQAETGTATINGIVEAKALPPEPVAAASVAVEAARAVAAAAAPSAGTSSSVAAAAVAIAPAATAAQAPVADAGKGGTVHILGDRVNVLEASIDASGPNGGGTVLIGGDYQGANPVIQNAQFTYVGAAARINVDATDKGSGGRAIVWADKATYFQAQLTARGGSNGGDGGFVETSGKGALIVRRAPDVSARRGGKGGTWLLDPTDIEIVASDGPGVSNTEFNAQTFQEAGTIDDASEITVATLLTALTGGDVIISTTSTGSGTGNITWSGAFNYNGIGGTRTLTLNANNNIAISGSITDSVAGTDVLNLTLAAGGAGSVSLSSSMNLGGGTLTISGANAASISGATISNATVARTAGQAVVVAGNSTVSNVVFDTDVILNSARTLTSSGTTLGIASGRTLSLQGGGANLHLSSNQTVSGPGSIMFGGADSNNSVGLQFTGQAVTLDGLTIGGTQGGSIGDTFGTTTNRSVIESLAAGKTLTVTRVVNAGDGVGGLNDGVLRVGGTSVLSLAGTWSNPGGTLDIQGGTVTLGGSFSSLGTVTRASSSTAGTVNLTGTFNNSGTFVFGNDTGVVNLAGGTISGGTLQKSGVGDLVLTANSTLSNVTLDMDFTIPAGRQLVSSGTTLGIASGRTLSLQGGGANLHLSSNQTVSGPGSIMFGGADSNNSVGLQFTGQAVTLDGLTIGGTQGGSIGDTFGTTTNRSVIESLAAGKTITVTGLVNQGDGVGVLNDGMLRVGGTGGLSLTGTWSNPGGTLDIQGGTVTLGGSFSSLGTVTRASSSTAGTVNLTGTFNNSGTFVFGNDTGVVNLAGGTISGGTLQKSGVGDLVLTANSTLSNVTLDMDFTIPAGRQLVSSGTTLGIASGRTLSLQGGGANLHLSSNQTVSGPGSIMFGGADSNNSVGLQFTGQAVTLDGLTIGGTQGGSIGDTFGTTTNRSVIESLAAGKTLTVTRVVNAGDGVGGLNDGVLRVGGTSVLSLAGTWSNPGGTLDIQGGTVTLGGSFSSLGTVTRASSSTAGTVNLTGTFNNSGTFVFGNDTGVVNLAGGTISGGTLQKSGVGDLVLTANSTLSNVTLDMDFTIPAGRQLVSSGTTLGIASGRTLSLQGGGANLHLSSNQTVSGPGSIMFGGADSNNSVGLQFTGQAVTLDGLTIGGTQGGSIGDTFGTTTNRSVIESLAAGKTITVTGLVNQGDGVGVLNDGMLRVGGTGGLSLTGTWSNPGGTLDIQGGTVTLGGSFSSLGTVTRASSSTAGTVNLTGTFNNSGTFVFGNDTGVVNLAGGTISGGTLQKSGVGDLVLTANSTLSNVTLDMDFTIPAGRQLVSSGTTLGIASGRTLSLQGGGANLHLSSNQTVSGPGSIMFGGADSNNSVGLQFTGQAVTLDGLTIGGTQGGSIGDTFGTTTNRSVIESLAAGKTLTVTRVVNAGDGVGGLNDGVLRVGGTSVLSLAGTWSNPGGTLDIQGGTVTLGGSFSSLGTVTRASSSTAGTVNLTGTFNNSGTFVFGNDTGVVNLAGGTISGGTLQKSGVGDLVLTANSTLSNVTLDMDFTIPAGRQLVSSGTTLGIASGRTLSLQGGGANLHLSSNQTVSGPGSIMFGGADSNNSVGLQFTGQAVTLDGLTIGGTQGGSIGDTFGSTANTGTIRSNVSGKTITFTGSSLTNSGTLEASGGGNLTVSGLGTNAGTITVGAGSVFSTNNSNLINNGTIVAGGTLNLGATRTLTSNGTIRPGASPGFMSITGNLDLGATSVTDIEINGLARGVDPGYDAIHASGMVTIVPGATLRVFHVDGFGAGASNVVGNTFNVISAGGTVSGTFSTTLQSQGDAFDYLVQNSSNSVLLQRGTSFTPVNFWNTDSSGNWGTGGNWSQGSVPVAGQIVIVDRGPSANPTITVNGALTSGRLQSTERIDLTGGTWTLSDNSTINAAFNASGGTITGAGTTLTTTGASNVTGNTNLTGATWNQQGSLAISGAGSLIVNAAAVYNNAVGATTTLSGTSTQPITFSSPGGVVNNAGTLVKSTGTGQTIFTTLNNTGQVDLATGNLTVSSGGTDTGIWSVGAGTTLQFNTGTRNINAAGSISGSGNVNFASGTVNFNAGSSFGIGATGSVTLSGGTLALATGSPVTIANPLSMSSGTLTGSDALSVNGNFGLTGGTLSGTGTLGTSGATTLTGPVSLNGKTWNQLGTLTIGGGGQLLVNVGSVLANASGATIDLTGTSTSPITWSTPGGAFNNAGTVNKSSATNQTIFSIVNNSGTVNVSGTSLIINGNGTDTGAWVPASGAVLNFNAGTRTFAAGATVGGPGSVTFTGGTLTFDAGAVMNVPAGGALSMTSGSLNVAAGASQTLAGAFDFIGGAFSAASDITLNGPFNWGSATMSGGGFLTTTAASTVNGSAALNGKTWNQQGTLDISGNGTLFVNTGSILNNGATKTITFSGTSSQPISYGTTPGTLNNAGTITKTTATSQTVFTTLNNTGQVTLNSSTGTLVMSGAGTDTGLWTAGAGTTLSFAGGTRDFNAGARVTGTGHLQLNGSTLNFNAGSQFDIQAGGAFTLANGSLSLATGSPVSLAASATFSTGSLIATDALTLSGPVSMIGGNISGAGTFTTSGSTSLTGSMQFIGKTWEQQGTVDISSGGSVFLNGGSVLNNGASSTILLSGTSTQPITYSSTPGTVNNAGTITKSSATPQTLFATLNNTGQVNANNSVLAMGGAGTDTGTWTVASGATLAFTQGTRAMNAGATLGGSGTVQVSGATLNFNAGSTYAPDAASTFTLSSGGVQFASGTPVVYNGTFNLTNGTFTATDAVTMNGPFNVQSGSILGTGTLTTTGATAVTGPFTLTGKTWNQQGAMTFTGGGSLSVNAGAVLNNAVSATIVFAGTGASPISYTSVIGTMNNAGTVTKSTSTTQTLFTQFNNTGLLDLQQGTLGISGSLTNTGTIETAAGSNLNTTSTAFTNAGTIGGIGTITTSGATLTNAGTLRPGLPTGTTTGTLTIDGNLVQTGTGVVNIEVGPTASDFDVLAVASGRTHTMTGGTLNITALGGFTGPANSLPVLTWANRVGTLMQGTFAPGVTVLYGPTSAGSLLASLGTSSLNEWIFAGSGDWTVGSNWSLGHAPTAGEDAVIADIGGGVFTITVPASGQTARSLVSAENLTISGAGALTLGTGASSIASTLTLAGALAADGPLSVHTLALTGGTLSGTGSVTVTNAFSQSGGTIALGGALDITQAAGNLVVNNALSAASIAARTLNGSIAINGALSSPGNVLLDAQGASADLTIAANVTKSAGPAASFEGRAANSVFVTSGASISSAGGAYDVVLNADRDASGAGAIRMDAGTSILSSGGDVTLGGGSTPLSGYARGTSADHVGVLLGGAQLVADAGAISIRGRGVDGAGDGMGVGVRSGSVVQVSSGNVTIDGKGGAGPGVGGSANVGVLIGDSTSRVTSTGSGSIAITGDNSGIAMSGTNNYGVSIGAVVESTATSGGGTISLTGHGGSGSDDNNGVYLSSAGSTRVSSNSGGITIVGTGGTATGSGNNGVRVRSGSLIQAANAATLSITGTGGTGTTDNHGVLVSDTGSRIQAADGAIALTGSGGTGVGGSARFNHGVNIDSGAEVIGTGAAPVSIIGTGGSGVDQLFAVNVETALVSVANGNLQIQGTGGTGTGHSVVGTRIYNGATIQATGTGSIDIQGAAGSGSSLNLFGVSVELGSVVTSAAGNIAITGVGGSGTGSNFAGIYLNTDAQVASTGGGSIALTGTGTAGGFGINAIGGGNMIGGASTSGTVSLRGLAGTGLAFDAGLRTTGDATLEAVGGGAVTQFGDPILANGLRVLGSGTFTLNSALNDVATLAGSLGGGTLTYRDANAVTIGSVGGTVGLTLPQTTSNTVVVNAGGGISLAQPVSAGIVSLLAGGDIATTMSGGTQINVSGAGSGGITLSGASIGTSSANRIGVDPGSGAVLVVANGDVFVEHTVGDLIAPSHYTISNAGSGRTIRLSTSDGRIEFGPTPAFNANTADDSIVIVASGPNGHIDHNGSVSWTTNTQPISYSGGGSFRVLSGTSYFNSAATLAMPTQVAAGATLDLNAASTLQSLALDGTLTGAGAKSIGTFDLATGAVNGGGAITVNNAFNWSGGSLAGSSSLTVAPAAVLTISGVADKLMEGPFVLNNQSTAGSTWTGTGSIDAAIPSQTLSTFNNSGVLTISTDADYRDGFIVNTGTLTKSGGSGTQTFNAESGGLSNTGTLNVDAGTVVLRGTGTHTGTFNVAGGRTLEFRSGTQFAGGQIDLADGTRLQGGGTFLASLGQLNLPGSSTGVTLDGGTTLALAGGSLTGTGTLHVQGTVTNTGNSSIGSPVINEGGTVSIAAGTLAFGAGYSQTAGTTQVGSGASLLLGGAMNMTGGSLGGTGDVVGQVTNNGGTVHPGGSGTIGTLVISGSYTQGATGTLSIDVAGTGINQADRLQVSGSAALDGSLAMVSSGGYQGATGDAVDVLSAATVTGSFASVSGNLALSPTALYSPGNVRVTFAPTGVNAWATDADGDWNVAGNWNLGRVPLATDNVLIDRGAANPRITIASGSQSVASVLSQENMTIAGGSLDVSQTSTWNAELLLSGGTLGGAGSKSVHTLGISSGGVSGGGPVTVTGAFNWSGGTLGGPGSLTVASSAVMSITGAADKFLDGPFVLTNQSAAGSTWSGTGSIRASSSSLPAATFNNTGVFTVATDASWRDGLIVNSKTLTKAGGTGTQVFNADSGGLSNSGTLNVDAGTLVSRGSGTHSGTFNVATGAALQFRSGSTAGVGQHDLADGATFAGTGGTVSVLGGPVNVTGTGAGVSLERGITFALSDTSLGGAGILHLHGTLASNGTSSIQGPVINSGGTLDVQSGTLTLASLYTQTGSTTQVAEQATLAVPLGFAMSNGILAGSGKIQGDVVVSGGTVQPGRAGAVGKLTIAGSYTQQSGATLEIEANATEVDLLQVEGTATLGGNLDVTPIGGYVPAPSTTVTPVVANAISGTFATVNGAEATYTGNSVQATFNTAPPVEAARQIQSIEQTLTRVEAPVRMATDDDTEELAPTAEEEKKRARKPQQCS